MRRLFIILAFLIPAGAVCPAGPLNLNVVYPKEGQTLPPVDSTFIFGSVDPGAGLKINDYPVTVHKEGGWLAFLPVTPGEFSFDIRAEKDGIEDTLKLNVRFPELTGYSFDSLYFVPGSYLPNESLWVSPGDKIEIGFNSLPYCNGICIVEPIGDTVYLREKPPRSYYAGQSVFDAGGNFDPGVAESLLIRGEYRGIYIVPATNIDSFYFVYKVYPPSAEQVIWMIEHGEQVYAPTMLPFHKLMALEPIPAETSIVYIRVLDPRSPATAGLKDTLTVIRVGPGKGYLCVHQPAGIRARIAGKKGPWIKLRLSDYRYGWVPDTAVYILPEGTTVPRSYIRRIRTMAGDEASSIIISTQGRHPFRVVENIEERSLTLYIFNADSDTDWIRYDNADELIDHIVWFQEEPGLFGIKVYLRVNRIWGYDVRYIGQEMHFDIIRSPEREQDISQFRFVIDPGHSPDPGAIGPTGLTEAEANLAIARRLKKELRKKGAEVILTRDDDSPLPLYDRPKIALREKANIFISIHNNALPDGINPFVNNGFSTYYYHPHSAPLARSVQKALRRKIDLNDFGLYHGNLAVNRPTQYPAILIECAFMMLPEQEAMLKTENYRKKVSKAIVEGIEDFLRDRALTDWDLRQLESYNRR